LIEELKKFPPNTKVYRDGGEYKDDYLEIGSTKQFKYWSISGVIIR
jgi:hypothetical protein